MLVGHMNSELKTCKSCHVAKPLEDFHADQRARNGRRNSCRQCVCARMKVRRTTPEGQAVLRDYWARIYAADPQKYIEKAAAWKAANPDRKRELGRNRWRTNPEVRAKQRMWRRANPLRLRAYAAQHRAWKRAAAGKFSGADWKSTVSDFNGRCAYCLKPGPLEIEHMTPLSRGGRHAADNIVPACRSCNASKYTSTPLEWLARGR